MSQNTSPCFRQPVNVLEGGEFLSLFLFIFFRSKIKIHYKNKALISIRRLITPITAQIAHVLRKLSLNAKYQFCIPCALSTIIRTPFWTLLSSKIRVADPDPVFFSRVGSGFPKVWVRFSKGSDPVFQRFGAGFPKVWLRLQSSRSKILLISNRQNLLVNNVVVIIYEIFFFFDKLTE